jgi:ureidoacrylate peracid hydrolase
MPAKARIILQAEYGPLEVDINRLAVLVIDMQNAFVSKGGMFDLWGFDISHIKNVIQPIKEVTGMARAKNIKVINIAHRINPDFSDVGPVSTFWHNKVMQSWREKPEWREKLIMKGTWGAEFIDELKPPANEMVIEKQRFSAFAGTYLDMTLKTFDVRYLIFAGVATNICVESSIRDAFHLEYFPILASDAVEACPPNRQEASLGNIKQCFGWVTTTTDILNVFGKV